MNLKLLRYNKTLISKSVYFYKRDGEEWLHFRRILNKIILKNDNSEWILSPCEQVAENIIKRWSELLQNNNKAVIPNLERELYRFSIDSKYNLVRVTSYDDILPKTSYEDTRSFRFLLLLNIRVYLSAVIAVLLGDKYTDSIKILEAEVAQLASVVNLIFQTSAKLSLIPANLAAILRLPAWKNFVKAADDGLSIGK